MAVRMPTLSPQLPSPGEYFVKQLVTGGTLQTLAEYANWLQGWVFLRCVPVIVRSFAHDDENIVCPATQTQWFPLRTDALTTHLFTALGISALDTDGEIAIELREEPAGAVTATPGSGAIIDAGCKWRETNGDLTSPVRDAAYHGFGLAWHTTGLLLPPTIVPAAPQSDQPRMIQCLAGTEQEIGLSWHDVALNSFTVWEAYRSEV